MTNQLRGTTAHQAGVEWSSYVWVYAGLFEYLFLELLAVMDPSDRLGIMSFPPNIILSSTN